MAPTAAAVSFSLPQNLSAAAASWSSLAAPWPVFENDGFAAVNKWTTDRLQAALDGFQGGRAKSPDRWEDHVVYSIMVDRFNNGDGTNDKINLPSFQLNELNSGNLYNVNSYRHGGDIQGIINRLDYLAELGVTSLWISPVLKHNGDYHGYCMTDPSQIDPGFGTESSLRELVREAHSRGIFVVLDIVINHLCDNNRETGYSNAGDAYKHVSCANQLSDSIWNSPGADTSPFKRDFRFSGEFFGPLRSKYFFSRCGPNSREEMQGEGPAAVWGDFTDGMYDFDTSNWDFQQVFTQLMQYWIAYADIDGFRLDAAKHVSEDFVAYFSTQARAFAAERVGKNNFLIVGEVAANVDWEARHLGYMRHYVEGPTPRGIVPKALTNRMATIKDVYLRHPTQKYPGLTSIYDFYFSGTSRNMLLETSDFGSATVQPSAVWGYFQGLNGAPGPIATLQSETPDFLQAWTLLEIHDWVRFIHNRPDDWGLINYSLFHLLMQQGTPIIYYGIEQGFNGNCDLSRNTIVGNGFDSIRQLCASSDDSLSRQCMFESCGWRLRSANGLGLPDTRIGQPYSPNFVDWRADPYLKTNQPVFQFARTLIAMRKSCRGLRQGTTVFREVVDRTGSSRRLAFSRVLIQNGLFQEFVILMNLGENDQVWTRLPVDGAVNGDNGQKYVNMFNPDSDYAFTGTENNNRFLYFGPNASGFRLQPRQVAIFAHVNNVNAALDTKYGTHLCVNSAM